jgi:hypothetical protein
MGRSCVVCVGNWLDKKNSEFFVFPQETERRKIWTIFARKCLNNPTWEPKKFSKLCGKHFTGDDHYTVCTEFRNQANLRTTLKKTAVPSIISWPVGVDAPSDGRDGNDPHHPNPGCVTPTTTTDSHSTQLKPQSSE